MKVGDTERLYKVVLSPLTGKFKKTIRSPALSVSVAISILCKVL